MHFVDSLRIHNDSQASLEYLSRLKDVRTLSVTMANDTVFEHIDHLPDLRSLDISGQAVNGSKMRFITNLKKLRTVNLRYTSVDDDALRYIGELFELESLFLTGTKISDLGIGRLSRLGNLKVLDISETDVSPACLDDIKRLLSLRDLNVVCARFHYDNTADFEGLRHLNLKSLRTNCLIVGLDGDPEIQALFPGCKVEALYYCKRDDVAFLNALDVDLSSDNPFQVLVK